METKKIIVHTDGGSRGNPGAAAIGIVIESNGSVLTEIGEYIGVTTNNVAEYTAALRALEWIIAHPQGESLQVSMCLDSQLVVRQLSGVYKIKDAKMKDLSSLVKKLERQLPGTVTYTSIPREENSAADRLVNMALDQLMR
jgi:ribonuclease HI